MIKVKVPVKLLGSDYPSIVEVWQQGFNAGVAQQAEHSTREEVEERGGSSPLPGSTKCVECGQVDGWHIGGCTLAPFNRPEVFNKTLESATVSTKCVECGADCPNPKCKEHPGRKYGGFHLEDGKPVPNVAPEQKKTCPYCGEEYDPHKSGYCPNALSEPLGHHPDPLIRQMGKDLKNMKGIFDGVKVDMPERPGHVNPKQDIARNVSSCYMCGHPGSDSRIMYHMASGWCCEECLKIAVGEYHYLRGFHDGVREMKK